MKKNTEYKNIFFKQNKYGINSQESSVFCRSILASPKQVSAIVPRTTGSGKRLKSFCFVLFCFLLLLLFANILKNTLKELR